MPVPTGKIEVRTYLTPAEHEELLALCARTRRSAAVEAAHAIIRHLAAPPLDAPPLPPARITDGPTPPRPGRPAGRRNASK